MSFDELTGLYDRTGLQVALKVLAGDSAAQGAPESGIALVLLDLGRFRTVNDGHGRHTGDRVLQAAALRLKAAFGERRVLARLESDMFGLVFSGVTSDGEAKRLAGEAAALLSDPYDIAGMRFSLQTRAGVVRFPAAAERGAEAIVAAETALARAKQAGPGAIMLFNRQMRERAWANARLEHDLALAMHSGEFFVLYQPRVAAEDFRPTSVEALIRWQHPTRGVVQPTDFIAAAELSGLIRSLGRFVLTRSCRQTVEWRARGIDLTVSINASAVELDDPNYAQMVLSTLERFGLEGAAIEIELTESVLMGSVALRREALQHLRKKGVRILIDDFGTGYSSLAYLHELPVDGIKIDRQFVLRLDEPSGVSVIRAIADLGHSLGLTVTAEGVEQLSQARRLKACGVDELQGYGFAKPLRAVQVEKWVNRRLAAN
ncbi:MAG: bifunctional diguanylate cyclase/phosphodiesterase [Parvibaculaceae bacterium]|nr:bifunctional diguanylate cyclase/phosphodiesterase [Parvibaculaceae bacterium]